jgi:hypothetical protein
MLSFPSQEFSIYWTISPAPVKIKQGLASSVNSFALKKLKTTKAEPMEPFNWQERCPFSWNGLDICEEAMRAMTDPVHCVESMVPIGN